MKFFIFLFCFSFQSYGKTFNFLNLNVENLFDTVHEKGKNDWAYVPLGTPGKIVNCKKIRSSYYRKSCQKIDWTKKKLKIKLQSVKLFFKNSFGKNIPEFFALQEVENHNVVSMLARELGYRRFVMTRSPDKRGIDVALLFNLPKGVKYISHKEIVHRGEMFKDKPTRNILQVEFKIKNQQFFIYVNHWPSQGNRNSKRMKVANNFKNEVKKVLRKNPRALILSVGDFNVIKENNPNATEDVVKKQMKFIDLFERFRKKDYRGTYYYRPRKSWNFLDKMFVNPPFLKSNAIEVVKKSFQILQPKNGTETYFFKEGGKKKTFNVPKRYDFFTQKVEEAGLSDHFPILVQFNLK